MTKNRSPMLGRLYLLIHRALASALTRCRLVRKYAGGLVTQQDHPPNPPHSDEFAYTLQALHC